MFMSRDVLNTHEFVITLLPPLSSESPFVLLASEKHTCSEKNHCHFDDDVNGEGQVYLDSVISCHTTEWRVYVRCTYSSFDGE